jgi:hypothetical protein
MILNVFGTSICFRLPRDVSVRLDGGSSLVTCWGMLAFVEAADTGKRQFCRPACRGSAQGETIRPGIRGRARQRPIDGEFYDGELAASLTTALTLILTESSTRGGRR